MRTSGHDRPSGVRRAGGRARHLSDARTRSARDDAHSTPGNPPDPDVAAAASVPPGKRSSRGRHPRAAPAQRRGRPACTGSNRRGELDDPTRRPVPKVVEVLDASGAPVARYHGDTLFYGGEVELDGGRSLRWCVPGLDAGRRAFRVLRGPFRLVEGQTELIRFEGTLRWRVDVSFFAEAAERLDSSPLALLSAYLAILDQARRPPPAPAPRRGHPRARVTGRRRNRTIQAEGCSACRF